MPAFDPNRDHRIAVEEAFMIPEIATFAADYTFETARDSVEAIDNLAIADRDKQKLYSLNAKRVFKL
jgi:predicted TIM-barrel fold metal-dependent hydrolase